MKVTFLCTFEPHTAGGILTLGRAKGAAANGHEVRVVFHPFKADRFVGREVRGRDIAGRNDDAVYGVPVTLVFSRFFSAGIGAKLLLLPKFILSDFRRVLCILCDSDFAVIHKPLPWSFAYMAALRLFGYRGTICCVHSDWEGIGGYADLTHPDKVLRKMVISFCEEVAPYIADIVWCASRTLFVRFGLSGKLRSKRIYLSCGGESFPTEDKSFAVPGGRSVIYSGTYKSRQVVEFLAETASIACRQSPGLQFIFLGTGPFLGGLRERTAMHAGADHVHCPGHVNHDKVIEFLGRAHFALLYLNREYPETYAEMSRSSTKLFEYLCAGTVVVASDFGEARELLAGSDSAFLEENTPVRFAQRLSWLDAKPAGELEAMSRGAAALFHERFSHKVQMKTLLAFKGRAAVNESLSSGE